MIIIFIIFLHFWWSRQMSIYYFYVFLKRKIFVYAKKNFFTRLKNNSCIFFIYLFMKKSFIRWTKRWQLVRFYFHKFKFETHFSLSISFSHLQSAWYFHRRKSFCLPYIYFSKDQWIAITVCFFSLKINNRWWSIYDHQTFSNKYFYLYYFFTFNFSFPLQTQQLIKINRNIFKNKIYLIKIKASARENVSSHDKIKTTNEWMNELEQIYFFSDWDFLLHISSFSFFGFMRYNINLRENVFILYTQACSACRLKVERWKMKRKIYDDGNS
jgi:hypothetical protein